MNGRHVSTAPLTSAQMHREVNAQMDAEGYPDPVGPCSVCRYVARHAA